MYPPDYSDFPPRIAAMITAGREEMDTLWPGWRVKARFDALPIESLKRLKWLLKREDLLTHRVTMPGPDGRMMSVPAPRDWPVHIHDDPRNPRRCFAVPHEPVAPVPSRDERIAALRAQIAELEAQS